MADDWKGWEKVGMGDEPIHEWDLKDNKILRGVFVEMRNNVGANNSNIYIIENKNGERVAFWGNTLLDTRLKNVVKNEEIGIEYLGKAKSEKTGREYHNFEIYRRPMVKTVNTEGEEVDPNDIPF